MNDQAQPGRRGDDSEHDWDTFPKWTVSKRKILKTWQQVLEPCGPFIEVKKTVVEQSGSGFVLTYRLRHENGEPVGQLVQLSGRDLDLVHLDRR